MPKFSRICEAIRPNGKTCDYPLKTTANGGRYCPRDGCNWKSWADKPAVIKGNAADIAPLKTPTAEQYVIFADAETNNDNVIINALAGTGKTTVLVQLVRIYAARGLSVACFAFAKRDERALLERTKNAPYVKTSNAAGLALMNSRDNQEKISTKDGLDRDYLDKIWLADGLTTRDAAGQFKNSNYPMFLNVITLVEKARSTLPLHYPDKPSDVQWEELVTRFNIEVRQADRAATIGYANQLFAQMADIPTGKEPQVDYTNQIFLPSYHRLTSKVKYDVVLCDEGQDLAYANRQLAIAYLADGGRLIAVGDENQALFAWRGADSDSLDRMAKVMAERGAVKSFPLTVCQRCSRTVIRKAQTVCPTIQAADHVLEGSFKQLNTDGMVDELTATRKGLVLCRANAPIISLCLKLLAKHVPARMMRNDVTSSLLALIDEVSGKKDTTHSVTFLSMAEQWLLLRKAKVATRRDSSALVKQEEDRVACLRALANAQSVTTVADLKAVIRNLFPGKEDETPDPDKYVVLSTVHGAKGNEADNVYLYSPEDYKSCLWDVTWSDDRDRDNTLVVALTRSRDAMTFVGKPPTLARLTPFNRHGEE